MGPTWRRPALRSGLARACLLVILLVAGAAGRAWALPGRVPAGQTIPPPPTATPTRTVSAQPTATWTPRPTWTRVPPPPPSPPTATTAPAESPPTVTPVEPVSSPGPTATVLPGLTATPTAVPPTAELTATASPPPGPVPLAFEVAVVPPVAGPQDAVQLILQVANVGYWPVDSVQVDVTLAADLLLQAVECPRCRVDCTQCQGGDAAARFSLFIGLLRAGEQVIAPINVRVAGDVWPGQALGTAWTLTATGLPAQAVTAEVLLPWAMLPATGGR